MNRCYTGCIHTADNCASMNSIHYCYIYGKNGDCIECMAHYEIYEWQCLEIQDNCKTFSMNGTCVLCKDSLYGENEFLYLPDENGKCIKEEEEPKQNTSESESSESSESESESKEKENSSQPNPPSPSTPSGTNSVSILLFLMAVSLLL